MTGFDLREGDEMRTRTLAAVAFVAAAIFAVGAAVAIAGSRPAVRAELSGYKEPRPSPAPGRERSRPRSARGRSVTS